MDVEQRERVEASLAVMRRTRWGVFLTATTLAVFLPGRMFWLTIPAALYWWTPLLIDSVRAFRSGWSQPKV